MQVLPTWDNDTIGRTNYSTNKYWLKFNFYFLEFFKIDTKIFKTRNSFYVRPRACTLLDMHKWNCEMKYFRYHSLIFFIF